jgi:hypothetical protein
VFNALFQKCNLFGIQYTAEHDGSISLVIGRGGFWELEVGVGHGAISPQKSSALVSEIQHEPTFARCRALGAQLDDMALLQ